MKSYAVIAFTLLSASCSLSSEPDCIHETRGVILDARLMSVASAPVAADTGTAQVNLFEARDADSRATSTRELTWFVGSGLNRADVTAVHVHEMETDRVLFTIPLDTPTGPPYVIAQIFTRVPYDGAVAWVELYELMGTERAYVDIHTTQFPQGQLRGELRRVNPNWQIFARAFCS